MVWRVLIGVTIGLFSVVCLAVDAPVFRAQELTQAILATDPSTRGIGVAERRAPVALQIQFETNSSTLRPEAAEQLHELWLALSSEVLRSRRVEIAGHTDGVGSAAYNLQLSRRRAAAVKQYLLTKGGLAAANLRDAGYGESRPIEENKLSSAINRRVEVSLLPVSSEDLAKKD